MRRRQQSGETKDSGGESGTPEKKIADDFDATKPVARETG
jgi:hypothetical protein